MRTAEEILVRRQYGREDAQTETTCPRWMTISACLLLMLSAMGDWKAINAQYGGLMKGLTVGVIGLGVLLMCMRPSRERLRQVQKPLLVCLSLMVALLLWSLVIWILNMTDKAAFLRGCEKLLYQSIAVLSAGALVYLLGTRAIDAFTLSVCTANGLMMLLELPNYGLVESIRSLVQCIGSFGDATGYARALEIHDLTFVMGQLMLYYALFAQAKTAQEKRWRWACLCATTFFFLVGMKRIAMPGLLVFGVLALLLRGRHSSGKWLLVLGVGWMVVFFFYIWAVRSGLVTLALQYLHIDMMGRDYVWMMATPHYDFSITYLGKGFEYVDAIVAQWVSEGTMDKALAFHNDILKVFVELGFPGMCLWGGLQYIVFPLLFRRYGNGDTALLYMMALSYMTVTYMTDNTSFYFWSTLCLRLLPLTHCVQCRRETAPQRRWRRPTREETRAQQQQLMQEEYTCHG